MKAFFISHSWLILPLVLLLAAAFFKFCLRGYDYICYTLLFIMLLILLHRFLPSGVWKIVLVTVSIGLAYFSVLEVLIVGSRRGDKDCGRKYLVVLGAAVHGDSPSLALTHRLEGALDYLVRYPEATAILCGGQGKGENISESECMYFWLCEHGISSDRLIMESESTTTMENLKNAFSIIRSIGDEPDGNVTLLSSAYHLYRAKAMAKLLGVEAKTAAGNPGYPVYMLNCYIREAFGLTHLWVFGY